QAARRACGRYLLFLNNDTAVPAGTLRKLIDFADRHLEAGLVGPRLRGVDGRVQISYRNFPRVTTLLHRTFLFRWLGWFRRDYRRYRGENFDSETARPVDVLMGAAVLTPRERFLAWGGWDEGFTFGGEDLELSHRVNGYAPVLFCPEAEVIHYGRVSTRA